jgi:hypothetical protein
MATSERPANFVKTHTFLDLGYQGHHFVNLCTERNKIERPGNELESTGNQSPMDSPTCIKPPGRSYCVMQIGSEPTTTCRKMRRVKCVTLHLLFAHDHWQAMRACRNGEVKEL